MTDCFAAPDELRSSDSVQDSPRFSHTENRSIRTAWLNENVVNYKSASDPSLLRAVYRSGEPVEADERVKKVLVTSAMRR